MGKFIDNTHIPKRKHPQRCTLPIAIPTFDWDEMKDAVQSMPDSWVCIGEQGAKGVADLELTYEARGANKTDITRRLGMTGIEYRVTGPAHTTMLCGCKSSEESCGG